MTIMVGSSLEWKDSNLLTQYQKQCRCLGLPGTATRLLWPFMWPMAKEIFGEPLIQWPSWGCEHFVNPYQKHFRHHERNLHKFSFHSNKVPKKDFPQTAGLINFQITNAFISNVSIISFQVLRKNKSVDLQFLTHEWCLLIYKICSHK